ncbi:class I SAM-dependent methyltransferase [Geodermatophilus sp. DF01-2]|uniref:class I SAM-dependent methyltransferase n=1 Tax=Geodermatophilus sp. DF01-2 TaxID=2559610 RepID=UPI00107345E8|nr:class I SAM-dependent methyltransferase [Geodermatophilus sp. DF01_2]TFV63943.1 class I SAM-dependent methyltransferase [Geodermatophilus sp. DF01_2]
MPDPDQLPGAALDASRMPGHWLLARLGKRVLRPGGRELTGAMLDALDIDSGDRVVELAPGLGTTTRLVLARNPASYIGIERDPAAAAQVRQLTTGPPVDCRIADAETTGLEDGGATVVFGEAMLTMQPDPAKLRIVREAARLLRPGGRYGIHELCLLPDDLDESAAERVRADLSRTIRIGARPSTVPEWRRLLESAGMSVVHEARAPMRLLEPTRVLRDEGVRGTARILRRLATDPVARRRVLAMRSQFRRHRHHLGAVSLIGRVDG